MFGAQMTLEVIYRRGMARRIPPAAYLEPVKSSTTRRSFVNAFGTPRARTWSIPKGGSQSGALAAKLQHDIARQLRDAIATSEWGSLAEFARQHGDISYDRLRGVLSGDVWIRLEDAAVLAELLGLQIRFS